MADIYVVCEGCGQRLRNWRRYPFAPLAQWMGLNNSRTARAVHLSGSTEQAVLCHGFTRRMVDRICEEHKMHPSEVWPEIVQHDIEDHSIPCEECGELFVPVRKGHRFCSHRCNSAPASRRYRKKRWHSDPEWRAAETADRQRRYRAGQRSELAKQRMRHEKLMAEDPDFYKRRYKKERERRLAYQREYRARKRAEREEAA